MNLEKSIGLIKIDVEGLEPKVINGLRKTIATHKPIVAWEAFSKESVDQSKEILQDLGVRYFYHLKKHSTRTPIVDKVLNLNKLSCDLVNLDECKKFEGLNIGSYHPLM